MGAEVLLLDKILNSKFQRGLRHSAMPDVNPSLRGEEKDEREKKSERKKWGEGEEGAEERCTLFISRRIR